VLVGSFRLRDVLYIDIEWLPSAVVNRAPAQQLWGRLKYSMPSSKPKVHLQSLLILHLPLVDCAPIT